MPVPEHLILEPKDPSIENTDDWPAFSLSKIKIYSQTGELVSLLKAHEDNPVNVIGHLEPVESEQSHLGMPPSIKFDLVTILIALSST